MRWRIEVVFPIHDAEQRRWIAQDVPEGHQMGPAARALGRARQGPLLGEEVLEIQTRQLGYPKPRGV